MKKVVVVFLSLIAAVSAFSQTWTVRTIDIDMGEIDYVYTIITKQQYERILNSHKLNNRYAVLAYIDNSILTSNEDDRIISGSIPQLNGYFYLNCEIIPRTNMGKEILGIVGTKTMICYGNSTTGYIKLLFCNYMATSVYRDVYSLNSDSFDQQYNRLLRAVNEK